MDEKLKNHIVEFLKSFTRILVQANLYSENHPQVRHSASDFISHLKLLIELMGIETVRLSLAHNKLILNNIPVLSIERIPTNLLTLYRKLHVDSIEFKKGLSDAELISFSKITSVKDVDAEIYLKNKNIVNISVIKEKYVRADLERTDLKSNDNELLFEGKNFVESIKEIVSRLYPDEMKQKEIVDTLLKKFKDEVELAIERAVNELKKEKLQIENDYARAESVISGIAGSEIIIDKNGNVIMSTPDAELVTGRGLKEISGKKLTEIIPDTNTVVNIASDISEVNDRKIQTDVEIKGDAELVKTVKSATAIVKNEQGKIIGTITVPHDLAKLKEVDQLKSDFISMITHELRSPLTSIKMALDLVSKEKGLDPSSKNMINAAVRNAEKLNSIINDILDFSKLQSGKMVFNLEQVSTYEVIEDAINSMKAWATSKNINLYSKLNSGLANVYADKRKTEQILINLISNAIKFTPENGKIEVGAYIEGQFVKFYVKDTGCGIKKEDIGKIFEKFVQAVSGEKVGGTGLGLAITKAMVVMQGGSIDVESEFGKGSTFYFKLPIYKVGEDENKQIENIEKKLPWWKRIFG